jgi:hypothetical protein
MIAKPDNSLVMAPGMGLQAHDFLWEGLTAAIRPGRFGRGTAVGRHRQGAVCSRRVASLAGVGISLGCQVS